MSITASVVGYNNNNNNNNNNNWCAKNKKSKTNKKSGSSSSSLSSSLSVLPLLPIKLSKGKDKSSNIIEQKVKNLKVMGKNCSQSLNSSISNSVITNASSSLSQQQQQLQAKYIKSKRNQSRYSNLHANSLHDSNNYLHLNSLWSIWYGVLLTLFQGYLAMHGAYRFLGCSLIPWKIEPVAELNAQIVLSGVVFILLPLFFTSAVFKVGNLANDGIKLAAGAKDRRCSMAPHDGLEEEARGGTLRALWTHGGPTAAFVHIVIAMCLLLPRLLLEARIIENGLLPKENIWQTELDFIVINRRNLVVLSVISSPYQNATTALNAADEDEEYYNDTMFTAINIGNGIGNTNNIIESKHINGKHGKVTATKTASKRRFFEVPDLINRDAIIEAEEEDIEGNEYKDKGRDVNGNGDGIGNGGKVGVGFESREDSSILREFDSSEFQVKHNFDNEDIGVESTTKATTTTTGVPIMTMTTAMAGKHLSNKYNVENWQKLGTLGKANSLNGIATVTSDIMTKSETETVTATVATTKIITSSSSSGSTTATTRKTRKKLTNKPEGTAATATIATTTNKITTGATKTLPTTTKTTTTTTETTTTTAATMSTPSSSISSLEYETTSNKLQNQQLYNNNNMKHHQQQQHHHQHHQHHNNQQQHHQQHQQHQHHHQQHKQQHHGKITRKHHQHQHHQQRQRVPHNQRRHHVTSHEAALSQSIESFELLPSLKSGTNNLENVNNNRFDEFGFESEATISTTTTRDSNIHIVKPEVLPEIIPSTPVSSNSKIIAIKPKVKKLVKRMAIMEQQQQHNLNDDDDGQVEIEPEYLLGSEFSANGNSTVVSSASSDEYIAKTADSSSDDDGTIETLIPITLPPSTPPAYVRLDGFAGMLQLFFGIDKPIDVAIFAQPPSAEFVNLLFALLVWCVRYPAVFWNTTKAFASIFSVQMVFACLDIIFSYIGISNLYKLQIYSEAMPIQNPGLVLNGIVTLSLFLLSTVLIIASSMIMYLYGHGRLASKMRDRSLITLKPSETWIYFAHCASLCFVLALAVVKAPLLNDLSATYKNNLHCPTFLSALISVIHLLLWIVIWLVLTIKRRWNFKLPPMDTYGIINKSTAQPLLMPTRGSIQSTGTGTSASTEQKSCSVSGSNGGTGTGIGTGGCGVGGVLSTATSTDIVGGMNAQEDIYWPKLTPSSPKLKVTFNEVTSTSDDVLLIGDQEQTDGKRHTTRGTAVCFTSATGEIDDGEYATLRAATAATVVGITVGVKGNNTSSIGSMAGGGAGAGVGGRGSYMEKVNNSKHGNIGGNSPAGGDKVLHLSEYDELPPPPPQLMSNIQGDYANLSGAGNSNGCISDDNISEEGKLLACVRDDSVTYASARDLEPPQPQPQSQPQLQRQSEPQTQEQPPAPPPLPVKGAAVPMPPAIAPHPYAANNGRRAPTATPEIMQLSSSPEHLVSPLAPVTVTVHTNEAHIASSSTPRCLRRADSGVPNEALTPRSDTTSTTESTTSPPERAPSESSSGVHSGEEREVEVVIRPRVVCKPPPKPPQPPIQEEPYGRCTNMRMSSFNADPASVARASNSATLPLQRTVPEQKIDYTAHCSTMPLPTGCHSQQHAMATGYAASSAHSMQQSAVSTFKAPTILYANSSVAMAGVNVAQLQQQLLQQHQQHQQHLPHQAHTVLPNGVRYSNPHFLRRLPQLSKAAESPYGHLGLGAGHHTFSKLVHDPLPAHSLVNTVIPEDRDSANYSMTSDQDCGLYATANPLH